MKNVGKTIGISLIILIIILISFVGIYQKKLNKMVNIVPDYKVGMEFGEERVIRFDVDLGTETIYVDENGNEIEHTHEEGEEHSEEEDALTKEVPVNPEEALNRENYAKVKEIMQKRLSELEAPEYQFRQDEDGNIAMELKEDENTDLYIEALINVGHFEIADSETSEVLLNNSHIKDASSVTYTDNSGYVHVYLIVDFNKEGRTKLEEISQVYVQSTDEEGNTTTKNVLITLDDQTMMNTYFGQTMSDGQIQIPIGSATTSISAISDYIREGHTIATILKYGELPIQYELTHNNTLTSSITERTIQMMVIVVAVIIGIMVMYLVVRYKVKGVLASISWIGFLASLLLVLRYTNCILSVNSVVGIAIVCVFDYLFLNALIHNKHNRSGKEILIQYAIMGIPMYIIALVFVFGTELAVSSLGMVLFWGNALLLAYNAIVTPNLLEEK